MLCRQRGRVVENTVLTANLIDMNGDQNLFASFCYVFENETLQDFPLLGGLSKQFQVSFMSLVKTKKSKKNLQPDSNILASPEACRGNC